MGCNIPRPWKRPPTPSPSDIEIMKKAIDEPILKAFDQFHRVAHDLTYHDTDLDKPIKRPLNCPNCCAPIAGPYCEYCGTVFEQSFSVLTTTDNEQIVIPIYIGQTRIDDIFRRNGGINK